MCHRTIDSINSQESRTALNGWLEYPTAPFPPSLRTTISKLPKGFENASLKSLLSLQTIEALAAFQQSVTVTPSSPQPLEQLSFETIQIAVQNGLTPLEICICFALSRYRQAYASQHDETSGLQHFLQVLARNQSTSRARSEFSSAFQTCWTEDRDDRAVLQCLVWIIAVIGATESQQPTDYEVFSGLWGNVFEYSECLYSQEALRDILCDFFHKETFLKEAEALRKGCSPPE